MVARDASGTVSLAESLGTLAREVRVRTLAYCRSGYCSEEWMSSDTLLWRILRNAAEQRREERGEKGDSRDVSVNAGRRRKPTLVWSRLPQRARAKGGVSRSRSLSNGKNEAVYRAGGRFCAGDFLHGGEDVLLGLESKNEEHRIDHV